MRTITTMIVIILLVNVGYLAFARPAVRVDRIIKIEKQGGYYDEIFEACREEGHYKLIDCATMMRLNENSTPVEKHG